MMFIKGAYNGKKKGDDCMSRVTGKMFYPLIKGTVRFFYPKIQVEGTENIPQGPAIIVANHAQMNGPIGCELYFPDNRYIWTAGQMMRLKDVPAYAFEDFWCQKPKWTHWFYRILSYLIAPFSVCIFNNASTIPVHRDGRILSTFKITVKLLGEGNRIIIFPEEDVKHNHIVYDFQTRFVDVAKLYYKKFGEELPFVPMYIAPSLKKMVIGKPIYFSSQTPIDEERERICKDLMESITQIACDLPRHRVIPYRNIPKKEYPFNKEESI
jgi:1-acyl-sn-glycerol-3-phosphate acyltransferase